jgi:hypothetical protein
MLMQNSVDSSDRFTKRFIIGFAFVEALLMGYMLLGGRIS